MAVDVKYVLLLPIVALIYTVIDIKFIPNKWKIKDESKIGTNAQKEELKGLQRGITKRATFGQILSLVLFFKANDWFIANMDNDDSKIYPDYYYSLRWLCLPVACLVFAIFNVGTRRFVSEDAITGDRTKGLDIHHRYLANTLEQTVIFTIIHMIIAICWTDSTNIPFIATDCCLFTSGRILFYRYTIWPHIPPKRALGFALTVMPSVFATIWCIFKLLISL